MSPRLLVLLCVWVTGCAAISTAPAANGDLRISDVQGAAARSPLEGREVAITGVVTQLLDDGRSGWFVQDGGDGDTATSDGLLVTATSVGGADAPARGDRVRVQGRVVERDTGNGATITVLDASQVTPLGRGAPAVATEIQTLPADWERFEGMRLRISAPLTISGTGSHARFGELATSFGGRLFTPTEIAVPGPAAQRVAADNARRTLLLDDARTGQDPSRVWYLPEAPRTGSTVDGVTGVLDQHHGAWRLQLDAALQPRVAPRPLTPRVAGDLRIASLNLENLFNGDGRGGGFPTLRGARSPAELRLQLDKLVATLHALDPDIAALMELENDGYDRESSLAQLVAALGPDWRFVGAGQGPGQDEIRVGLVYRRSRVAMVGGAATLVDGPFGTRSRAPLAQAFKPLKDGADDGPVFIVAANHFKSKGCSEATGADLDQKDGQGCWNALRTASAQRLDAWLRTDPTRSGSDLALIVGDLNAYARENPVQKLIALGWIDALKAANVADPYSFVFDSQTGRLDHALLSPALARRLSGAIEWHVNADEPASSGYRAGGTGPWGSSDHDPLLIGFSLRGTR
jgi:uncharacterized protein